MRTTAGALIMIGLAVTGCATENIVLSLPPPTVSTTVVLEAVVEQTVATTTTRAVRLAPQTQITDTLPPPPPVYADFDCRWIDTGLTARGVKPGWVQFAVTIATRESACCPNVRGGERTDGATCTITHVVNRTHRSDTGAFQFNGVHYKTTAGIFCPEFSCSQQTILDDPEMQLDMMVVMMGMCGKGPWRPPYYCQEAEVLL